MLAAGGLCRPMLWSFSGAEGPGVGVQGQRDALRAGFLTP